MQFSKVLGLIVVTAFVSAHNPCVNVGSLGGPMPLVTSNANLTEFFLGEEHFSNPTSACLRSCDLQNEYIVIR